ncbi:MAG: alpha/beta fold hydrolase [Maricaulaceae bacterium]
MPTTLKATVNDIAFTAQLFKAATDEPKALLFCLPGGGAGAGFFDLAPDYSFAVRMTARGFDVMTMDHPGTVSNPLPEDHPFLTPRQSADYVAAALEEFASYTTRPIIGIGHSMGGMMSTLLQAKHNAYVGLALLGSSAGGLDWGLTEEEREYIEKPEDFERDIEALTLAKFKMPFPPSMGGPSGKSITFGGETEALNEALRENACPLFAAGGMMSMTRGSFRQEVEAIDVPMFFAFGDHDIGIPPKDAPKDYINAPSAELVILENTGHNSLAFSSIAALCQSLEDWAASIA